MPIYMKFDGIVGPVTYDKSKGWIELRFMAVVRLSPRLHVPRLTKNLLYTQV